MDFETGPALDMNARILKTRTHLLNFRRMNARVLKARTRLRRIRRKSDNLTNTESVQNPVGSARGNDENSLRRQHEESSEPQNYHVSDYAT